MRNTLSIFGALLLLAFVAAPSAVLAGKEPCGEDVDVCVKQMLEKIRQKGWVGVELDWPEDGGPPTVTRVVPESPAVAAGLAEGDVLEAMNGIAYADHNSMKVKKAYKNLEPGDQLVYTVRRGDSVSEIEVTLGQVPDRVAAQWIGNHVIYQHASSGEQEAVAEVGKKD